MNLPNNRYAHLVGKRIGSLVFMRISSVRGDNNRILGHFMCDCGNEAMLPLGRVINGKKRTHCGCKTDHGKSRTHGMRNSAEYSSWQAMKSRCLNHSTKEYERYGGIGITIHPEWIDSFESFYSHIGPRPKGTSLDRIDNLRGYQPGNVRWATSVEQACNRCTSFVWSINGQTFDSATAAASYFGVSDTTIHRWVKGGFDSRRKKHFGPRENCYVVSKY